MVLLFNDGRSITTAEQNNYFGKATPLEPSANPDHFYEQVTGYTLAPRGGDYTIRHYQSLAAGLAAFRATENTRAGLSDAMKLKEVYATTGTRVTDRVFADWDFEASDVQCPDGANLDRVQVVKVWLDAMCELHEQVFDVVCSDDRVINTMHRCDRPVGNMVDVSNATFTSSIGDALLMGLWKVDPKLQAFYYIRILEIPTLRWTTYDAAFFGVELPGGMPATHLKRACTSLIWCTSWVIALSAQRVACRMSEANHPEDPSAGMPAFARARRVSRILWSICACATGLGIRLSRIIE